MLWRPISVHEFVAEFLLSERHKFAAIEHHLSIQLTGVTPTKLFAIIDNPNLTDAFENHLRLRLLYLTRCFLLGEIPPDTQWYEVRNLTDTELRDLHVIARCGWDDPKGADKNELLAVAERKPQTLTKPPASWRRPILWGHDKTGPFTIIEGNNRLTAYASTKPAPGLSVPALIGLSPTPCFWHIHDPARIIANDRWKNG